MPSAPVNGQIVRISSTRTITALTLNANSGQSMNAAVTLSITATPYSAAVAYMYDTTATTWYRIR
jgi:hypothetical protein